MTESSYIPGMCNINAAEVAYRRKAMWFGIGLSALLFLALFLFHAEWWIGALVLFVPVYIAAIGFLQVRNKFCVSYGSKGRQNADEGSDAAQQVTEAGALNADKRKTKTMNLQALAITVFTLLITSVVLYIA